MSEFVKQKYDDIYSNGRKVFGEPSDIVTSIPQYLKLGDVLDIGAGIGRHSIFLAELGFDVVALDISSVAIKKLRSFASRQKLSLDARESDITNLSIDSEYGVILTTYVLHHLQTLTAFRLLQQMREQTRTSGLNCVVLFRKESEFYKKNTRRDMFYPGKGELKELYAKWKILSYNEFSGTLFEKNPDGSDMHTEVSAILAKKPATI